MSELGGYIEVPAGALADETDTLGWDTDVHGRMIDAAAPDDVVRTQTVEELEVEQLGRARRAVRYDLVGALTRFGLGPFIEITPGAQTRGNPLFTPRGSIGHHTAGPKSGDRPSLNICVNGRSDLPGPLCNTFLSRSKVIVVAYGRANHAGTGGYKGMAGNSSVWGCEAESTGLGDGGWTPFQKWAWPRVHAAHIWLSKTDASYFCNHRDWTTRKIDAAGIDTADMRRQITAVLNGTATSGDDMPLNDDDIKRVRQVVQDEFRAIFDTLTPGKPGVKNTGDVYGKLETLLARQGGYGKRIEDTQSDVVDIKGAMPTAANLAASLKPAITEALKGAQGASADEVANRVVNTIIARLEK